MTRTHDSHFRNNITRSDHNMKYMTTTRKRTKYNFNIKIYPYIFPDSVLNTPFKKTIEDIIERNLNAIDDPNIDD